MEELDYLKRIDIAMIAPSRVGKTSLISAIYTEFSQGSANSGILFEANDNDDIHEYRRGCLRIAPDPNFSKISTRGHLESLLFSYTGDVSGLNFTAAREGTKDPVLLSFSLKGLPVTEGKEGLTMPLKILDYQGGDVSSFATGGNKLVLRQYIPKCFALVVPIFSLALLGKAELLQKMGKDGVANEEQSRKSKKLHEVLEINHVLNLIETWCRERIKSNKKGVLLFAPVKCETYFNEKDDATREQSIGFLLQRVKVDYFEGLQQSLATKLTKEELAKIRDLIAVEYCPAQTFGAMIHKGHIRWDREGFKDVYELRGQQPNPVPFGGAWIMYKILERRNKLMSAILSAKATADRVAVGSQNRIEWLINAVFGRNRKRLAEAAEFEQEADAHKQFIADVGHMVGVVGNRYSDSWEWPSDWVVQNRVVKCPQCGRAMRMRYREAMDCPSCGGRVVAIW